jgi:hypothetical protein
MQVSEQKRQSADHDVTNLKVLYLKIGSFFAKHVIVSLITLEFLWIGVMSEMDRSPGGDDVVLWGVNFVGGL